MALLMPISLTVFAKNTKASEDAKMESKRNDDMIEALRCTLPDLLRSKTRNTGRNMNAPRMFCQATNVTGEYFKVSFFRKPEKTSADNTAPKRANTPFPSAEKERSLEPTIIATPMNETIIPKIFSLEIFSLKISHASTGENTGIVAMITLEMVAEVYFTPKFSPKK